MKRGDKFTKLLRRRILQAKRIKSVATKEGRPVESVIARQIENELSMVLKIYLEFLDETRRKL